MIGHKALAVSLLFLLATPSFAEPAKPAPAKPSAATPAAAKPAAKKPAAKKPAVKKPAPAKAAPAVPPPVEAFGQLPAISAADINPAGNRLAWIDNSGKLARVAMFDLATNRELREINMPSETIPRRVIWADDQTLLVNVSVIKTEFGIKKILREWRRWFAVDAGGGSPRMLLTLTGNLEKETNPIVVRRRTSKPGTIHMSAWGSAPGFLASVTYNLYEVDLASGEGKTLERGSTFTIDWATDATGQIAVRADWNAGRDKFSVFVKGPGDWRRLHEGRLCGRPWALYLAPDDKSVVALGRTCEEPRVKLWSLPLDGTARTALVEVPQLDVEDLTLDPVTETVVAATLAGDDGQQVWLDSRAEQRLYALRRSFNADWITTVGHSTDNQRVVVRVEGASQPPVFHLVDNAAKRADIINEAYPRLSNARLSPVQSFKYEARDKYPLVARLTLPVDGPVQNLPLVVLPHDGPESRDPDEFDWLTQFFASRGYAVLQPQFRGSTGFGLAHADAGRRQWGLRMQNDVTDAISSAISKGFADPKRVCIVGLGYGGYVALAGATSTPELFACTASINGIADLPSLLDYLDKASDNGRYWREHIGNRLDKSVVRASPSQNANKARTPILLIHGSEDSVVPVQQSRTMARALRQAGKPHELIELAGEDHWLSRSENRIRTLSELERFLAKHLGPAGPPN
jgi:dipeptidyl aminopeptidase/acylaminoacyl peptidase